jgi:hypothetical protein
MGQATPKINKNKDKDIKRLKSPLKEFKSPIKSSISAACSSIMKKAEEESHLHQA